MSKSSKPTRSKSKDKAKSDNGGPKHNANYQHTLSATVKNQKSKLESDSDSETDEQKLQRELWALEEDFAVPTFDEEPPEFDPLDSLYHLYRGHKDSIREICYDSSNGLLYSASWDETVLVWNCRDGSQLAVLGHNSWVNGLGLVTKPEKGVVTAAEDGNLSFWVFSEEAVEFRVMFQLSLGVAPLTCMWVHHDDNFVFAGALMRVSAVHLSSGSVVREYSLKTDVNVIRSQDDVLYCGCDDGIITCFDIQGAFPLRELRGHTGPVRCLQVTDFLVLYSGGDDKTVKAWTLSTGQCQKTYSHHKRGVRALALHVGERDRFLISASLDGTVRAMKLSSGKSVISHSGLISSMVLVPDHIGTSQGHLVCGDHIGKIFRFPLQGTENRLMGTAAKSGDAKKNDQEDKAAA